MGSIPGLGRSLVLWSNYTHSSVQFSHSVVSNSLRPHGLQHTRLPCLSLTPGTYSNSCPFNHLILCCPLLLLPSIFPSIRVFSSESALQSRPKDWSFSFRISPSNEQSGLISFRMDWLSLPQPLTREGSGGMRARVLLGFHCEHPQRDRLGFGGPPERRRGLCLPSFGTGRGAELLKPPAVFTLPRPRLSPRSQHSDTVHV